MNRAPLIPAGLNQDSIYMGLGEHSSTSPWIQNSTGNAFIRTVTTMKFDQLRKVNPVTLEIQKYARKIFYVDCVQVTAENMEDVAKWCKGKVITPEAPEPSYIKVDVRKPLNDKQTQAHLGDWVLNAGQGFKVYTPKAFANSFEELTGEAADRMVQAGKEKLKEKFFAPKPGPRVPPRMKLTELSNGDFVVNYEKPIEQEIQQAPVEIGPANVHTQVPAEEALLKYEQAQVGPAPAEEALDVTL